MKRLRTVSALMFAAVMAASSLAQNQDDLQKQLAELKATLQTQARTLEKQGKALERLETENADLKSQSGSDNLDTEINRVSERVASSTNLRSCASQLRLGGEFRFRGYYEHFEHTPIVLGEGDQTRDGTWVDQRVRLNFQYDFGCDVTAFAEVQSRFAWGDSTDGPFFDWNHTRPDEVPGAVGMYQAWLEFRNIFCRPELSTRIGRQEVVLGNQFQFGNADWYNGVVFDGIRADWHGRCFNVTGLAAKLTTLDGDINQLPSYFTDHDDDELYSLYFTLKAFKFATIDLYWIYINGHGGFAQNSGASWFDSPFLYPLQNAYYHTFGARVGGTIGIGCGLDNVEAAIQTGTTHIAGFELDTDGVTAEAEIGYTFSRKRHIRVFARGLFAEGADDGSTGYLINYPNRHTYGGFRARYGIADLIPMTNVHSAQLGASFDPACNWTVGVTALWAETDKGIGGGNNAYGEEFDLWAEYRYSANIGIGAGVAVVIPDTAGEILWGVTDSTQVVGYLQARLVF